MNGYISYVISSLFVLWLFFGTACVADAQTLNGNQKKVSANNRNVKIMKEIEDKLALKELVDTFSVLADKKKRKSKRCFSPKTQRSKATPMVSKPLH